jgi:hypothetical protein
MAAFLRMPPWRTGSASHIDPLSADLVGGQSAACVGQRGHYQGMGWRLMQSSPEKGEDRLAAVVFWFNMVIRTTSTQTSKSLARPEQKARRASPGSRWARTAVSQMPGSFRTRHTS